LPVGRDAALREAAEADKRTVRLARHEVTIEAVASVVYRHLTQVEGLLKWMAVDAVADPVPGGELKWTHANGMIGRFVEPIPSRRIVFTYGWEEEITERRSLISSPRTPFRRVGRSGSVIRSSSSTYRR
jgi:uncharacterized protein YndB with AHSA1/START domain